MVEALGQQASSCGGDVVQGEGLLGAEGLLQRDIPLAGVGLFEVWIEGIDGCVIGTGGRGRRCGGHLRLRCGEGTGVAGEARGAYAVVALSAEGEAGVIKETATRAEQAIGDAETRREVVVGGLPKGCAFWGGDRGGEVGGLRHGVGRVAVGVGRGRVQVPAQAGGDAEALPERCRSRFRERHRLRPTSENLRLRQRGPQPLQPRYLHWDPDSGRYRQPGPEAHQHLVC